MGFVKSLVQFVKGDSLKDQVASENSSSDKRVHGRFRLGEFDCLKVIASDGQTGLLQDVSYGGFAVIPPKGFESSFSRDGVYTLSFFNQTCRCQAILVNQRAHTYGFSFLHSTPNTLIFLRNVIEYLKAGDSMTTIDKSLVNTKYKSPDYAVFRGFGPSDLILQLTGQSGKLDKGIINFLRDGIYREVSFQDGQFKVFEPDTGDDDIYGEKIQHQEIGLDKNDLFLGAMILVGAYGKLRHPAIKEWLQCFQDKLTEATFAAKNRTA